MVVLIKYFIGCIMIWFISYSIYFFRIRSVTSLFNLKMKDNYFIYLLKHLTKLYKFIIPIYNIVLLIKVSTKNLSELKNFL